MMRAPERLKAAQGSKGRADKASRAGIQSLMGEGDASRHQSTGGMAGCTALELN